MPHTFSFVSRAAWSFLLLSVALASPLNQERSSNANCRKTQVAVLGAGAAGITAAQALANASIHDFLILEYNSQVGGRVAHTTFGKQANGQPYTIELGANWVQGLGSPGGPENPIWTLAKKYKLENTYSNYSSIQTFSQNGAHDFTDLLNDFNDPYATLEEDAGYILTQNLQDRSVRTGLRLAGWNPKKDPAKEASEWWLFDWEYAYNPEQSSQLFAIVNYNTTFYQYSDANNYVFDQRGFNAFIKGEASTFLGANDPRLLLNTIVANVSYSDTGVVVTNKDGSCVSADYAICTFSLGVLQNDAVDFSPSFPSWKETSIASMSMGTYTKIFMQWPSHQVFWDTNTQFFLYADPVERGYYPVFQSLDGPGFLPGSGILFVTVVQDQSYTVEAQDDATTKAQVLAVLRSMYGEDKVPEPEAFYYPRWSLEPWAYGSYSNVPPSMTLEMMENFRANLGRLWFAGEAYSPEYYGFLQGAYFEGQAAGAQIAGCINGNKTDCNNRKQYDVLHGTTSPDQYNPSNGWLVSSFLTYGFD